RCAAASSIPGAVEVAARAAAGVRRSAAGDHEDVVGAEPEDKAHEQAPHQRLGLAEPGCGLEELNDDVQDRAGSEREKGEEQRVVDDGVADDGADKRWTAADRSRRQQETPARPFA